MLVSADKIDECLSFECIITGDLSGREVPEKAKMSETITSAFYKSWYLIEGNWITLETLIKIQKIFIKDLIQVMNFEIYLQINILKKMPYLLIF